MKYLLPYILVLEVALSLCLLGNACGMESGGAADGRASETADYSGSANPNGLSIYREHCVICHGIDGNLGLNGAGDLTKSTLSMESKVLQITKGKNLMTPFEDRLSPEEIKAVAAYTFRLKKQ